MVLDALNDALGSALQGQENMPRQSAAMLIEKFLSSGLMIYLVMLRAPLWMLAAVSLFTGIVSLLVNATAFRSLLPTLRWPSVATMRALVNSRDAVYGLGRLSYSVQPDRSGHSQDGDE